MKGKSGARYLLILEVIVLLVVLGLVGYKQLKLDKEPAKETEVTKKEDIQQDKPQNEQVKPEKPAILTGFSDKVKDKITKMTLEQKVAQLFFLTPEMLTKTPKVTVTGPGTRTALDQYPIGGLLYGKDNFQGKEQTSKLLGLAQTYYREKYELPLFLGLSEEGGNDYSPLATANKYPVQPMASEYQTVQKAAASAAIVSGYLKESGFNMNLALHTTSGVTGEKRSFNGKADVVQKFVSAQMKEYQQRNVMPVMQTFPSNISSMEKYADCIMVEDIAAKNITGDDALSCMFSSKAIEQLRTQKEFKGIVMSSPLNAETVTRKYKPEEAAVKAILAGNDILFLPADFGIAYKSVIDAVKNGTITEERLNQSVGRILTKKLEMR